jgi:hypothetical protein
MQQPTSVLIHEFTHLSTARDEDGDIMIGFYYQFIDDNDQPIASAVGPFTYGKDAERAALHAFKTRDF